MMATSDGVTCCMLRRLNGREDFVACGKDLERPCDGQVKWLPVCNDCNRELASETATTQPSSSSQQQHQQQSEKVRRRVPRIPTTIKKINQAIRKTRETAVCVPAPGNDCNVACTDDYIGTSYDQPPDIPEERLQADAISIVHALERKEGEADSHMRSCCQLAVRLGRIISIKWELEKERYGDDKCADFKKELREWLNCISFKGKPIDLKQAKRFMTLHALDRNNDTKWMLESGLRFSYLYTISAKKVSEICSKLEVQDMLCLPPREWRELTAEGVPAPCASMAESSLSSSASTHAIEVDTNVDGISAGEFIESDGNMDADVSSIAESNENGDESSSEETDDSVDDGFGNGQARHADRRLEGNGHFTFKNPLAAQSAVVAKEFSQKRGKHSTQHLSSKKTAPPQQSSSTRALTSKKRKRQNSGDIEDGHNATGKTPKMRRTNKSRQAIKAKAVYPTGATSTSAGVPSISELRRALASIDNHPDIIN